MRRIIIKEARPGMRVTRSIPDPRNPSEVAVPGGAELTLTQIIRMHELGVYDLWVDEPELEFFEEFTLSQWSPGQQRLAEALLSSCRTVIVNGGGASESTADPRKSLLKRNQFAIQEVIHGVVKAAPTVPCFDALALQHDELLRHSCDVCVLAMLLGLRLEEYLVEHRPRLNRRQARDVLNLALGSLFHDVGELLMPVTQRESLKNLTFEVPALEIACSNDDWKQHTSQGYGMVRQQLEPTAATIVLHHHQHFDGTGFAMVDSRMLRQRGGELHVFSRIAMAADVFHHLLQPADAGLAFPMVRALWEVQQEPVRSWFDPEVLGVLLEIMPPFVPGMVVTLSGWRQAIVTRVNGNARCFPEVRVLRGMEEGEGELINLAEDRSVQIVDVGGAEVGAYLYGARSGRALAMA